MIELARLAGSPRLEAGSRIVGDRPGARFTTDAGAPTASGAVQLRHRSVFPGGSMRWLRPAQLAQAPGDWWNWQSGRAELPFSRTRGSAGTHWKKAARCTLAGDLPAHAGATDFQLPYLRLARYAGAARCAIKCCRGAGELHSRAITVSTGLGEDGLFSSVSNRPTIAESWLGAGGTRKANRRVYDCLHSRFGEC